MGGTRSCALIERRREGRRLGDVVQVVNGSAAPGLSGNAG